MARQRGDQSPSSIPATEDELTPPWFSAILAEHGGETVLAVELEPLPGLSTRVFRARLASDKKAPELPQSVIVKLPLAPGRPLPAGSAYEREMRFYERLAGSCPVAVPSMYWAEIDVRTGRFALVLEDFPGHRPLSEFPGDGQPELATALEAMARLHARWWGSPELQDAVFLRTLDDFIDRVEAALARGLSRFLARFDDLLSPEERCLVESLPEEFRRIAGPLGDAPATLVHHDLSLRNILFGAGDHEPRVVFIDWQLAQRNAAVRDLSYFIGTSLGPMKEERPAVAFYHQRLLAEGVRDYPSARFEEDYARSVVCDFARMVMTAGQEALAPAMADIVAAQLKRRSGVVAKLGLLEL